LIKTPEASVFFGKQQYNVGLVSLVTDLYDYREKWVSGTIGRGNEVLYNVCISILAGSTPTWLQKMLPEDAFIGGFMSRFVIVEMPVSYAKKDALPQKANTGVEWSALVDELKELSKMKGEFKWGEGSKELYKKYYDELLPTGNVQQDAYREREPEQILKLSMLLAVSDHTMTVTSKHIEQAHNILHALRVETDPRIDRLTTHPRMNVVQEIRDILNMYGELSENDLLSHVYRILSHGEIQFYEALRILKKINALKVRSEAGIYYYSLKQKRRTRAIPEDLPTD